MNPFALARRILSPVLGLAAVAALASCSSRNLTTIYQAQIGGKTFLVQKLEKKSFSTIIWDTLITFNGKAPIVIDNVALSQSLPYEEGIYGKTPFHRIDDKPQKYLIDGKRYPKMRVVIYIDPKLYSRAEFDELVTVLKAHASLVSEAVEKDPNLTKYQIAGAVYGRVEDFVEIFTKNNKDRYEVRPDGDVARVQLDANGIKGMESRSIGGLSNVEAGRKIFITDAKEIPLKSLQSYKNPQGQSLPERFKISIQTLKKP